MNVLGLDLKKMLITISVQNKVELHQLELINPQPVDYYRSMEGGFTFFIQFTPFAASIDSKLF